MNTRELRFTLNGEKVVVNISPNTLLVDLLREKLNLTGTKVGCGIGECGACTVLVDGKPVNSCLALALSVENTVVETIEGLEKDGRLHPIQETFIEAGAVQCGFCTPGMIMSAKALLDRNPKPSEKEIVEGLSGNLCRCTGYQKIVVSVKKAAEKLADKGVG